MSYFTDLIDIVPALQTSFFTICWKVWGFKTVVETGRKAQVGLLRCWSCSSPELNTGYITVFTFLKKPSTYTYLGFVYFLVFMPYFKCKIYLSLSLLISYLPPATDVGRNHSREGKVDIYIFLLEKKHYYSNIL